MSSTQNARLDQIAELTRGLDLPLPAVDPDILTLILEAVSMAWEYVKTNHAATLQSCEEAAISALLEAWLNAELSNIPGLDLIVTSVDRGRETVNFDGRRLEMRPDLSFRLTHQDARFRLIAECKIIDTNNGKTPALYRDKGIARFVAGDYAWASREAIMLGYVRCGSILKPTMLDSLHLHSSAECDSVSDKSGVSASIPVDALGTSIHRRKFSYVHGAAQPQAGNIELWHLWLTV